MENSSQTEDTFIPLSQINNEYKRLNDDLIKAINIFKLIFESGLVSNEDIKALKKLNIEFNDFNFNQPCYYIFGEKIKLNILKAT